MADNQLTKEELLNSGFLNAISAIFHGLDTKEKQDAFSDMVAKTVNLKGIDNLTDGIAEKANDSSAIGGGPGCVYVRGVGWVCDQKT